MDTPIVSHCRHGAGCTHLVCRLQAQITQERAQGTYQVPRLHAVNDATFPAHIRQRHNLQGR